MTSPPKYNKLDFMKLVQKQKFFSWFDSYDIFDENNNVAFQIQGRLSWGHKLEIYDARGNYLGKIEEKIFTLLPRFEFFIGDESVGFLRRKLTFFRPQFELEHNNWRIDGDFWGWDYTVTDGGSTVMTCSKKLFNWTDTYEMDIRKSSDALLCLMIALSIDIEKCSRSKG